MFSIPLLLSHLLLPFADKDVHRLVFISVSHAHAGVYKSVIANKMGKATCYAHLYVTGKDWKDLLCSISTQNISLSKCLSSQLLRLPP